MTPAATGRSSPHPSAWRLVGQASIAIAVGILFAACPPPHPPNPNLLCFPQVSGVPHYGGAPNIDGRLSGLVPSPEFGWTGSFRYTFGNGSQTPNAAVQGNRDANNLYLSFEVNFASSPDLLDGVLLVFSPTKNDPTNDRKIFIGPFQQNSPPQANTPFAPTTVKYWVDSTGDNWNNAANAAGQASTAPMFLQNNIMIQRDASNTWYMEIKIPTGGGATNGIPNKVNDTSINLPANGDFGFYFDILDHTNMGYVESTFPKSTGLTAGGVFPGDGIPKPESNTPSAGAWARGSLGGIQCNGVNFDPEWDIAIQHPDSVQSIASDVLSLNQKNTFTVTVWNDSVDANNNRIVAQDVDARFKIGDFGIAGKGDYADIPNGTHNCPPNANEPAAHTCLNVDVPVPPNNNIQGSAVISADWTLTAPQQATYAANLHQCILVELDSNATNPFTILLNKSGVRNMDFAQTMSPYRQTVSVSAGRERREDSDVILITRTANTPPDAKWAVDLQGAQPVAGKPGVFTLRTRGGAASKIDGVTEPPRIAIPSQDIRIPPNAGADGRGVPLRVRPGELITVIADGSIQVRRDKQLRAGAGGVALEARSDQQYLLPAGFAPGSRVGALVAAWNGDYKGRPVLIGSERTVKVPDGVDTITFAINDTAAGYAEHSGEGFHLQVIATPLEPYMAVTNTSILRNPAVEALRIPLGINLPTVVTCGYRKTGRQISVNGVTDDLLEQINCYGYMFNKIAMQ